jgi:hypothetical protein
LLHHGGEIVAIVVPLPGSVIHLVESSRAVGSGGRQGTGLLSIWMLWVSCVFLFLLFSGDQFLKVSAPIFVGRIFK